jgi:hypothetical protein
VIENGGTPTYQLREQIKNKFRKKIRLIPETDGALFVMGATVAVNVARSIRGGGSLAQPAARLVICPNGQWFCAKKRFSITITT